MTIARRGSGVIMPMCGREGGQKGTIIAQNTHTHVLREVRKCTYLYIHGNTRILHLFIFKYLLILLTTTQPTVDMTVTTVPQYYNG